MFHEIVTVDGGAMYPVAIYRAPRLSPVAESFLRH